MGCLFNILLDLKLKKNEGNCFGSILPPVRFEPGPAGWEGQKLPLCNWVSPNRRLIIMLQPRQLMMLLTNLKAFINQAWRAQLIARNCGRPINSKPCWVSFRGKKLKVQFSDNFEPWTQSYKNIFSVDLCYTEFWAFLLANKYHVTIFSQLKG